jgi:hypothetical protein
MEKEKWYHPNFLHCQFDLGFQGIKKFSRTSEASKFLFYPNLNLQPILTF